METTLACSDQWPVAIFGVVAMVVIGAVLVVAFWVSFQDRNV